MVKKKIKNEGYTTETLRFRVDWLPIFKRAWKLSNYDSMNAWVMSLVMRSPEFIQAWEQAGKPVLPDLIGRKGNPAFFKNRPQPTRGLWGRPVEDGDTE